MKKFFNKNYIYILVFSFALLASYRLIRPGYFSMQDDMHVFRLQQFDACIKDGQIPCRFIRDGGLGYGYPLFNYYSPWPYMFAESFHLLGVSFIDSLKIAFIAPAFIRAFSMFLLASAFFGPLGGLISSAFYSLAPYMALNTFVRGALAETWALSLLPLVLWSLYRQKPNIFIVSLTVLLLSHNLTLAYFLPLLIIFAILTKNIHFLFQQGIWSFIFSAFFLIPAFFEKNLVTVDTMTQGYFAYIIHFTTLFQLFVSRFWGYGASLWGPVDDMSFQIGWLHWLVPTIIFIFSLKSKNFPHRKLLIFFFAMGAFALFLTHNKSTFIWQMLPFMAYFQFPWRFLGLAVLCFSIIAGALTKIKFVNNRLFILLLIAAVIALNINYFKEDIWYPRFTDTDKLTSAEIYRQSGAGLMDYWPRGSASFPTSMALELPTVLSGDVNQSRFTKSSHRAYGRVVVSTPAEIILPLVNFPRWQLLINNQPSEVITDPTSGLIKLSFSPGSHNYRLRLVNTPIRTFANIVSLFGLGIYIIKVVREKKQ